MLVKNLIMKIKQNWWYYLLKHSTTYPENRRYGIKKSIDYSKHLNFR